MKHILGALALFLCVAIAPLAQAQDADTGAVHIPEDLTSENVRDLMSGLSDEQVRGLLLERLDAVAAEQAAVTENGNTLSDLFHHATTGAVGEIITSLKAIPYLFKYQAQAFSTFVDTFGMADIAKFFGLLAIIIIAGLVAEWVVNKVTSRWHLVKADDPGPENLRAAVTTLTKRLVRNLLGLIVFLAVARTVAVAILPQELLPIGKIILFNLVAVPRIAFAFTRFLLAPTRPQYRFVNTDDATAKFLTRHIIGFTLLIGFTIAILGFNDLNGVPADKMRLGFWLNLGLHLYIVWIAWTAREGLIMMMRGDDGDVSSIEEKVSSAYPWFAIIVSMGTWWLVIVLISYGKGEMLQAAPHFKSMALLLAAPALDTLVRGVVRHAMPPMSGEGIVAEQAQIATERSYVRIGRVVVFGIVIIQIAGFWGMSPGSLASGAVSEEFAANIVEFLIMIAVGYLLWEVISVIVNRKLAAEMTASGYVPDEEAIGGDGGGAGSSRLSTVLPLVLLASQTAIVVLFTLLALSSLGIDTTPLLAGAGIAGLAIGFGAQKLVGDVVSGVFFLVDDAFRLGEYVQVDDTAGTVEKIAVRSLQLRHHRGLVHTIPYGEIPKITNFSRDWVIMKLKFTVPFDTDPEQVRKIFKKIGQDIQAMDEFKDDMLQPFKSQGVLSFDDVGMVIRGKFMAKPGTQFMMRKVIYNRVKSDLNAAGIEFARREVRVRMPDMEDGNDPENQSNEDQNKAKTTTAAAGGAAAAIIEATKPIPK